MSMTSHYIVNELCQAGYDINFQKSIYIPNIRAEETAGFDLSIGHAFERPRVRTMNKHLFGNQSFNRWCDEEWSWEIRGNNGIDHRHLCSLIRNYENENNIFRPFLILHICFCLHEYRRMGMNLEDITIPNFISPLRTIVVNIGSILENQNQVNPNELLYSNDFVLRIDKTIVERNEAESRNEYLSRIEDSELFTATATGSNIALTLPTITLSEFVQHHVAPIFNSNA